MGQKIRRNSNVVVDDLTLCKTGLRIKDLREIGDFDFYSVDIQLCFRAPSSSFLTHHVCGVLILEGPHKRVGATSNRPSLGESDLADQFGLQPMTAFHFGPRDSASESSTL